MQKITITIEDATMETLVAVAGSGLTGAIVFHPAGIETPAPGQDGIVSSGGGGGETPTPENSTAAYDASIKAAIEGAEANDLLDKSGVPWDERIHSSNKKRTKDEMWARRRNLQDAHFNDIHTQLLLAQKIGKPPVETEPEEAPALTTAPALSKAPDVDPNDPATFAALVTRITSDGIGKERLDEACTQLMLGSLTDLAQRADLIAPFWAAIK